MCTGEEQPGEQQGGGEQAGRAGAADEAVHRGEAGRLGAPLQQPGDRAEEES